MLIVIVVIFNIFKNLSDHWKNIDVQRKHVCMCVCVWHSAISPNNNRTIYLKRKKNKDEEEKKKKKENYKNKQEEKETRKEV